MVWAREEKKGHVLRSAMDLKVEGGRPKRTWKEVVEEEMREWNLTEENIQNRREWTTLTSRQTP